MNTQLLKLYTAASILIGITYIVTTTDIPEPLEYVSVSTPYIVAETLIDPNQTECLALNVYHEARGEGIIGKLAVAHVTLNRVKHKRFPESVCEVVYQGKVGISWQGKEFPVRNKCQFSWWCDGKDDTPHNITMWEKSVHLAKQVLLGNTEDPTAGATHYYNPHKVDPYWKNSFELAAVVGNHTFLR